MDTAPASLPNVCKMPGPPPPFVPSPLPNIGKSGDKLSKCTKKVLFENKKVAIKGSYYMSIGDMASKGTGGGLLSATTHGKTEFVAPGSMNVKAEGKNIQLLGDAMTNNGSSKNTGATLPGNLQPSAPPAVGAAELECGEVGTYGDQKKRTGKGKYHRDHIPSKAALKERARELNGGDISSAQAKAIENLAVSVVIPASAHRKVSPTYGGRNKGKISGDAGGLQKAAQRDTEEMKKELDEHADDECVKAYKEAADKIDKVTDAEYDQFLNNILKTVK